MGKKKKMIVKAEREKVKDCFTCALCTNLYDCATTISECLHTFCRKCIYDKIIEEYMKTCPICNVGLGVTPLDKLRMDSRLDDMRLKFFPPKPKRVMAETETTKASLQSSQEKDKSLSSLLATSLRLSSSHEPNHEAPLESNVVSEQVEAVPLIQNSSKPMLKFRRSNRKNPRLIRDNDTELEQEQPHQECEDDLKNILNIGQDNGLIAGTSEIYIQKENNLEEGNEDIPILSSDLGKSLSNDKRATPLKKSDALVIVEPIISQNGKEHHDNVVSSKEVAGEKPEECAEENQNTDLIRSKGNVEKFHGEVNENTILISSASNTKKISGKKPKNNGESTSKKSSGEKSKGNDYSLPVLRPQRGQRKVNSAGTSQDVIPLEAEKKVEGKSNPVWFSLVASENQNTDRPLPQISTGYLRVTNGNLPVSYVKKYLVKKLGLESEDEVEIWLRHEPVCSTQKLHNLVDWWVQTTPISERRSAMVGSSGAEFVMVLFYSRPPFPHS